MNEALPASAAGKPVEVWFQDEARVGQKGWIPYRWAPIGSRPPAVRDNRHDSVYLFGAICPDREVGAAIIMPAANTAAMNEHLKEISTQVRPDAHAVLICDGAGWHQRGKQLKVPANITLIRLPPYSPELNSMENVWHYSYCVIKFLPDSTRVCHAWRFSLVEAGCGSRIRQTRQRITVRNLCRDTGNSARTCRPGGAISILLHWLIASWPAEERRTHGRARGAGTGAGEAPVAASPGGQS